LQLQQHKAEIDLLELQVVVVTFETPQYAKAYVDETGFPWPLLIDESRSLYRAYGMDRGSFLAIWGPQNWGAYFKLMARGRMPRRPHNDVNQLGGDALVDPDGIVRLHHIGRGPADRPSTDSLLAAVKAGTKKRPRA
jgi:hypothetical protein